MGSKTIVSLERALRPVLGYTSGVRITTRNTSAYTIERCIHNNGGTWGDMNIVGGQADYQFSFPMEVFLGHAGTVEDPYPVSGFIKGSVFVDN